MKARVKRQIERAVKHERQDQMNAAKQYVRSRLYDERREGMDMIRRESPIIRCVFREDPWLIHTMKKEGKRYEYDRYMNEQIARELAEQLLAEQVVEIHKEETWQGIIVRAEVRLYKDPYERHIVMPKRDDYLFD